MWALSTTTTEAIKCEPQRFATEATAALAVADHSKRTPAVAHKRSWRSQDQFSHQLVRHEPRQPSDATENTELKTSMMASSPSLVFLASSTHSRMRVIAFLVYAAKTKPRLAGPCTRLCTPSLQSTINRGFQPGAALDDAFFRSIKRH